MHFCPVHYLYYCFSYICLSEQINDDDFPVHSRCSYLVNFVEKTWENWKDGHWPRTSDVWHQRDGTEHNFYSAAPINSRTFQWTSLIFPWHAVIWLNINFNKNGRSQLRWRQQQPFYGPLSRTTRVSWYQKKHSPTHHPDRIQSLSGSFIYHDP